MDTGFNVFAVAEGGLFLLLAYMAQKGSANAMMIGTSLYILETLFFFYLLTTPEGSIGVIGLGVRAFFTYELIRGAMAAHRLSHAGGV